ncbi:STAS domain-containing protein [Candidatus Sumerlaeota bacterium]|nr:STAS domain-containing protein [Candidatus Sumerlaeota bacterium]
MGYYPESLRNLSGYARRDLRRDIVSGLTVGVAGIPQVMAYAIVAGLPPVYGLYSAIVSCVVAAVLGSSNHLVTGPTNPTSIIVFSVTATYAGQANHLEVVLLLTLLTGLIELGFGLLRLGGLMRYVSNSVLVGFTAGAAIVIAAGQLKEILGIAVDRSHATTFGGMLWQVGTHISRSNPYTLGVALFTVAVILGARRIHRRLPTHLLAVILSAALVCALGWHRGAAGEAKVPVLMSIQEIRGTLNMFHIPSLIVPSGLSPGLIHQIAPGAVALAIMSLVMTSSAARASAVGSGQRVDFSREFAAQGIAKIVGAFFQNFAGAGSLTRSALCQQSGGRTRMAAIVSAAITALALVSLAPLVGYIPIASLAGMVVVIAYEMVEKHRLHLVLKSGRDSRLVFGVTLGAAVILPLQYAIFVGVFMSIAFLLRATSRPDLTVLVPRSDGRFEEAPFERQALSPILLVNIEGDLYFAAAENLDDHLLRALSPETRVVILRMKRLRAVGSTAMAILEHFWQILRGRGIALVVCGIERDLVGLMTRSGLRQRIGEPNIFYADNLLLQSTELALARAQGIVEMERRRREAVAKVPAGEPSKTRVPRARDLMTRRCVRFGEGHSLREAVWLLSGLIQRGDGSDANALFLQDRRGSLAAEITPRLLLERMVSGWDPSRDPDMSDSEMGRRFGEHFAEVLADVARKEMPRLTPETRLASLLRLVTRSEAGIVPICDASGRLAGQVGLDDLIVGLGQILDLPSLDPNSAVGKEGAGADPRRNGERNEG